MKLREKGHEVTLDTREFDLIIGVECWRIIPGMEDMIDVAVKAARSIKYGSKEAKGTGTDDEEEFGDTEVKY